jgi:hypothetical protein
MAGFSPDSPLEGDGFEIPVPGALGESNPKNLNRSPKRQDVQLFFFLSLPVAGCPNGGGFLVNGHDVDVRRNYSVAST